jgi:hypothetical protein
MLTMTLSQHLTLHWLNLQIEATHTQDEGFERQRSKAKVKSYQLSPRNIHKCKTSILEIKTKSTDPTNTNEHV